MNWVDLIIILTLIFFAVEGFGKSFISEFLDFLGFLAAFFLSLNFYNVAGTFFLTNFQLPHSIANVLGFTAVWFVTESILFGVVRLSLSDINYLSKLNRYLSPIAMVPAFLRGLIFVSLALVIIATFPLAPKIKIAVENSRYGSQILKRTHSIETPLKSIFGGITQDTLTFLTIKPETNESVDLGFRTEEFVVDEKLESEMIVLVNQERTKVSLHTLEFDSQLRQVARFHSEDMFKRGYFSHYSPEGKNVADRAQSFGVDYKVIGENLAYAPELMLAHTGLMNSPGHKANILSKDFNKIGIGIINGGTYGLMVTQVFSN